MIRTLGWMICATVTLIGCGAGKEPGGGQVNGVRTHIEDWQDLQGCYSTVMFNGQPGLPHYRGSFSLNERFGFATMPGAESIRSFNFFLFNYEQAGTSYYGMAFVFPDFGTTERSTDGKTRTFAFHGPMICTEFCGSPIPFTLETRVEVTDLGDDQFQVRNFRRVPELPDRSMDADDTYVIKRDRQNCRVD